MSQGICLRCNMIVHSLDAHEITFHKNGPVSSTTVDVCVASTHA